MANSKELPNGAPILDPTAKVGFGLGMAAFVMAFVPWVTFATWLVAIPAIVLSVIGMVKSSARAQPILGLVFAILGWGVSLFAIVITAAWLGPESDDDFSIGDSPSEVSEGSVSTDPVVWAEFETMVLEGSGDDVVVLEQPIAIAAIDVTGNAESRYFGIRPIMDSGETGSSLVNTTDPFDGTLLVEATSDESVVGFEISSAGPWTLTIKSVSETPVLTRGETLDGDGAFLVRLEPTDSLTTLTVKGNADGRYFGVRQHGDGSFSVINTTEPYDGTVRLEPGSSLLEINAFGAWSMVIN
jgi:hypothetical protein